MSLPLVAIVGRPNVGKSTLFNRLAGRKIAVVDEISALTRDRIYAECEWTGRHFRVVDTGGIQPLSKDPLIRRVLGQTQLAIQESDVILFVVDGKEGLTTLDLEVAELLRRANKPKILVVNKLESVKRQQETTEFFRLGFDEFVDISAIHGTNIDELLDKLVDLLPAVTEEAEAIGEEAIKVAIVGRPNVGKSSLLNAILDQERAIVDEAPGTTRDAIDTFFKYNGYSFIFIDTAGIRRKARIHSPIEYYSILRALAAIERADVVILMLDVKDGITEQDKKIGGIAHDAGKACIIVVNKWDLIDKSFVIYGVEKVAHDKRSLMQDYIKIVKREYLFLDYAPIIFCSAITRLGVPEIIKKVVTVAQEYEKRIATAALNKVIEEALIEHPPPMKDNRKLKIYYATQPKTKPPTIVLFVNEPELLHFSYRRYLENRLRATFRFEGVPLRFLVRRKDKRISVARAAKRSR